MGRQPKEQEYNHLNLNMYELNSFDFCLQNFSIYSAPLTPIVDGNSTCPIAQAKSLQSSLTLLKFQIQPTSKFFQL